jgi:photosystem II stability/assembly factor-like uncharacterized protein
MRRGIAALALAGLPLTAAAAYTQALSSAPVATSLTIFAGTAEGLWRSRDWGGSWEAVTAPQGSVAPTGAALTIQPLGPRVYVGAGRSLYLSDDFGETWTALPVPGRVLAVLSSRYPGSDPTLFVGTTEGLIRSPDAGRTFGGPALRGVAVTRLEWPGPALVAATTEGVMVSLNGGTTFSGSGVGLPKVEVLSLALSSFFAMDPVMFAGTTRVGLFRSSDAGATWSLAGLAGRRVSDLVWLGPFLYAATEAGLQRSEDLGLTWTTLSEGLDRRPLRRLLFPLAPGSGSEIFAAADEGVFHSTDGGEHWLPAGLQGRAVLSLGTFPPLVAPRKDKRKR